MDTSISYSASVFIYLLGPIYYALLITMSEISRAFDIDEIGLVRNRLLLARLL